MNGTTIWNGHLWLVDPLSCSKVVLKIWEIAGIDHSKVTDKSIIEMLPFNPSGYAHSGACYIQHKKILFNKLSGDISRARKLSRLVTHSGT